MHLSSIARTLLPAALAVAMAASQVAALEGDVVADSYSYSGGANQQGPLTAFNLGSVGGTTPFLGLQAKHMEAVIIEHQFVAGPTVAGIQGPSVRDPTDTAPASEVALDDASATLTSSQEKFGIHILTTSGPVDFEATTTAGLFDNYGQVYVSGAPMKDGAAPGDDFIQTRDFEDYWSILYDAPHVVHRDQGGATGVTVSGTFVVELFGVTLQAEDASGRMITLESGLWHDPIVDDPLSAGPARERTVFVRLFLQDAVLDLNAQGGNPVVFWATPTLSSQHAGEAVLQDATGTMDSRGLNGERYVVPAGSSLALAPASSGLAVHAQPANVVGPPAGTAWNGWIGAGAVLALVGAIAVGLVARAVNRPDMRAVEAAIEGGRHDKAARMAKRILHRIPGLEDAALARAIALSRGGHPQGAVQAVRDQLAHHDASDGSLHYVMGLSLLDLGQHADARVALDEAVRRTPALAADVAARLGPADPIPPAREANGYA